LHIASIKCLFLSIRLVGAFDYIVGLAVTHKHHLQPPAALGVADEPQRRRLRLMFWPSVERILPLAAAEALQDLPFTDVVYNFEFIGHCFRNVIVDSHIPSLYFSLYIQAQYESTSSVSAE